MNVKQAIKKRRSIRSYKSKPVTDKNVKVLKEALKWAPSAGNLQARYFYFIKSKGKIVEIVKKADVQSFVKQAPLLIVCCANLESISMRYGARGRELYSICDVSASIQNLMLQATELGLGTCWIGSFNEEKVKQVLGIEDELRPIALVPVGYPNEKPNAPDRLPEENLFESIK